MSALFKKFVKVADKYAALTGESPNQFDDMAAAVDPESGLSDRLKAFNNLSLKDRTFFLKIQNAEGRTRKTNHLVK